jgi:hypothetical protein
MQPPEENNGPDRRRVDRVTPASFQVVIGLRLFIQTLEFNPDRGR